MVPFSPFPILVLFDYSFPVSVLIPFGKKGERPTFGYLLDTFTKRR
jgi:hypothetical protein